MNISEHKLVRFHYELSTDGGVTAGSKNDEALVYVHGTQGLLPALEDAMEGHAQGDEFRLELDPGQAYGPRREELVHRVSRSQFPPGAEIVAGTAVTASTPDGEHRMTVVDVADEEVTLDGNHPLAGMRLVFDVKVLEVRDATEEELEGATRSKG